MSGLGNADEVWRQYFEARLRFIETELDLGITFCQLAQTTGEPESRMRNISNAEKAAETAKSSLRNMNLDSVDAARLRGKLQELDSLLEDCKG